MTTNQPRSAGSRLWWIIRTTLLIFIIVALIAAAVAGLGYAGYLFQQSDNSLALRIDANQQNLNSLRDLVDSEFAKGDPEQQVQIDQLENEVAALTEQLETLQTARAENTAVQTEQLNSLETELATTVAQNSDLTGELETVQEALVALQSDINNNGSRIDDLGGDLDQLQTQLSTLDETLAETSGDATAAREGATADLQQTLTLLKLWGVLTNARLALLDGDEVMAETAVAQAIVLSNALTAETDSPMADALERLQARLDLAAAGFTADLPMVAQDLEAASLELNLLLSSPIPETEVVEATPTATETAESAEETATPTSTSAPSETPLPSPTPTP